MKARYNPEVQEEAAAREFTQAVERLHTLEAICGIAPTPVSRLTWAYVNQRTAELEAVAGSAIDPNDPGIQKQPIILGQWKEEHAKRSPLSFFRR